MKWDLKNVVPVDQKSFRRHIFISCILHLLFCVVSFFILRSKALINFDPLYVYITLIFLNCAFLFFVFDLKKYAGRFDDIYPIHRFSFGLYLLTFFVPLLFIILTLHLFFKAGHSEFAPPRWYKLRYAALVIVPLMVMQVMSPKAAYWLSSPSTFYVVKLTHNTMDLMDYKKSAGYRDNFLENYRLESGLKVDTTQLVLLIAINSALIHKERARSIASGVNEKEAGFKASLDLLRMCHEALELSKDSQLDFFDYGPLHWLHPSGPTEILLLTMVDSEVRSDSNQALHMSSREMITKLEFDLGSLSPLLQADYGKQLAKLRTKF